MEEHCIPGEVIAAAHAFPDHGLASSADRPLASGTPVDDPDAEGRAWPRGAAGGEAPAASGGGAHVGGQVPFARRGPLAVGGDPFAPVLAQGLGRGARQNAALRPSELGGASLDAGALGVMQAYAAGREDPQAAQRPATQATRPPASARGRARSQVWTDLAVESIRTPERIPGVAVEEDHRGLLQISRVRIETEEAELRVGKRRGRYITLEAPGLRRRNAALQEDTARALADELRSFLPEEQDAEILVVGLGNWNATPDALGPRVVGDLLITRHLREQVPEDLRGGLRSLCAVAPGVLGTTGIETSEIIRAIVDRIKPDAMIAVDALASRSIDRIAATIQLADTGIHPGSGVGNDRGDLSSETLGVPVIAVGVPTVVHAFTIASDTVDLLIQRIPRRAEFAGLRAMGGEEKRRLIAEVLTPSVGDLMVTPKEIDVLIEDMSRIIAAGINAAVHPKIAQQPTLF
jgi:spore protease